ncbi:unnamed protein product [Rotaria magnacalcarata]|uniref:EGF-like domain-containing protein n=1 Tax=Rotaria magnacalcarata TaxID=392030 RepID=A0A816T0W4_9BILA|nr:unnamed protein product [Rotaria magnacalcarata]
MLIDEQKKVAFYHCGTKFNIYLLYPKQSKNSLANCSTHIDVFDKITIKYWANSQQLESCPLSCTKYGRCIRYVNKQFSYFCPCDQGHSGIQCELQENCSRSSDSFCRALSICICLLHKHGPTCYLKFSICQLLSTPCENDGICVPIDDRIVRNKFTCLCKGTFYGRRCENSKSEIDVNVDGETFEQTTAIFIHFITAFENVQHQRITTPEKMKYDESTIEPFVTHSFHIVIGELLNKSYYLLVSRDASIESEYIQTEFLPNHRCIFVRELLIKTFRSYPRLRRIKYYPLLCRQSQQLKCFYDENYMCICDLDRFSNCFTFNHFSTYDCHDHNDCENGGQCFQGNATCPSVIV